MRSLALILPALLALPACALDQVHPAGAASAAAAVADASGAPPPAAAADRTVLDERLGRGAEVAYAAASRLGTALARGGLIDRARFRDLDDRAYAALLVVRQAYRAGNAPGYVAAVDRLNAAVAGVNALVR